MIRRDGTQLVVNGLKVEHRQINPMVEPTRFECTLTIRATGASVDHAALAFEKLTVLMARDILKFAGQNTLDEINDMEVDNG